MTINDRRSHNLSAVSILKLEQQVNIKKYKHK